VRERYHVTDITILRWRKDPALDFPQPIEIRGRNYFAEDALDAFDARMAGMPLTPATQRFR